jgi:dUTP pyrophosphatase
MIKLKVKKLATDAKLPHYSRIGDAALDIYCSSIDTTSEKYIEYGTSIAMEIPEGYLGLLFPRSSITNYDLSLKNSVGVIDENYRGEIKFRMATYMSPQKTFDMFQSLSVDGQYELKTETYNIGDRIGQLVIVPKVLVDVKEVEALSETNRNEGGYGSSGK